MQFVQKNSDIFTIRLSESELYMLNSSLGQVTSGNAMPRPDEFEGRIGTTREVLKALRHRIQEVERAVDIDIDNNRQSPKTGVLELSNQDLLMIVRSLNELANGVKIPEWEFHILVGFYRDEVRSLLHDLHRLLVHNDKDLEKFKAGGV